VCDFRSNIITFANKSKKEVRVMREIARKNVVSDFNYIKIAAKYTKVLSQAVSQFQKQKSS
jgi:hypothetical protein